MYLASATTGTTYGVWGRNDSPSGRGVYGWTSATTGVAYGVYGRSDSSAGRGVYGWASATTGVAYGVYGQSDSPSGYAGYFEGNSRVTGDLTVDGTLTNSGIGDITAVTAGVGLDGGGTSGNVTLDIEVPLSLTGGAATAAIIHCTNSATSGWGVYGVASATSGNTFGVFGSSASTNGRGVLGYALATSGLTDGVQGRSYSTDGRGVYGMAIATSGTTSGVYGVTASSDGHGVYYSGGLAGTGTKSCVVKTSQGPTLMYCQESPENWFEDFGEGRLVNGRARIELDPLFLETVTVDEANPMKVFVEVGDECNGVFVRRGLAGFEVVELHGGTSSIQFCYRVVAKRKGFEEKRLDYCAAAEGDSYLFPELREKEPRELEEERAHLMEE